MPDISRITLPSGSTYEIKDSVARDMISAGVSFIIAWDGASAPVAANIPTGVTVTYNNVTTTGILTAASAVAGAFYLIKSKTLPTSDTLDIYDEYVVVKPSSEDDTTWYWEKIGDTKVNLTNVVTDVSYTPHTDSVLGTGTTINVTQPTITLATDSTSGTGKVEIVASVSESNTNVKATASGAKTAWNSKDAVNAVTGYASPTTDTFVKTVSTTSKKLVTTSITGVSGSTTASKATSATAKTAATGAGTTSTTNTDWLKGVSVSNETLIIGAATMNTDSIPQYTFSNVTVPTAASATTVATGAVANSDTNGASVVTAASAGTSADALTGLGTASTSSVIGANSTFTITQPTIALSTGATAGTGVVSLTNSVSHTSTYLGATASDAAATWGIHDTVYALTRETELTVTKGQE